MIQRVWRIWNEKDNRFMPTPKNVTGTYATERGARAALTQMTKWGAARAQRECFTIVPCYLIAASEVTFEVEEEIAKDAS